MGNDFDLNVLLVEDDKESLHQLENTLPSELLNCHLYYDPINSFEEAFQKLKIQRYDLVLTDIYRDRPNKSVKTEEDAEAKSIVDRIRKYRFCPIVVFTDGSFLDSILERRGPFLKLVDKSKHNSIEKAMMEILQTGIPQIARRLHDELDQCAGPTFLWGPLEKNWEQLSAKGHSTPAILERLIRRRASVQMGRINPKSEPAEEISTVSAPEFYIMPPISANYRLGFVLKRKSDSTFHVLLTPHCYLELHEGSKAPKAEYMLLVPAFPFEQVLQREVDRKSESPWPSKQDKILDMLRRRTQSPPDLGRPNGRYWFLPGFLDIPDMYCDFLQVRSVPMEEKEQYDSIAVLDSPFAEAFQACFTSFYSSVGLPNLNPEEFAHLSGAGEGQK